MTPDHEATAREIVARWDGDPPSLTYLAASHLRAAIADALSRAASGADKRALVKAREEIAKLAHSFSGVLRDSYASGVRDCSAILDRHIAAAGEPAVPAVSLELYQLAQGVEAEVRRQKDDAILKLRGIEAERDVLRERVAVLEGALEDLTASAEADYIDETTADEPDDSSVASDECGAVKTTFGMIRRARAALSGAAVEGDGWRPIAEAPRDDGWLSSCLLGRMQSWGWETWVGQCDDHDIWLGRMGDGNCFECQVPTHYRLLPAPPSPAPAAGGKGEA